jgi:hypothetical protein
LSELSFFYFLQPAPNEGVRYRNKKIAAQYKRMAQQKREQINICWLLLILSRAARLCLPATG